MESAICIIKSASLHISESLKALKILAISNFLNKSLRGLKVGKNYFDLTKGTALSNSNFLESLSILEGRKVYLELVVTMDFTPVNVSKQRSYMLMKFIQPFRGMKLYYHRSDQWCKSIRYMNGLLIGMLLTRQGVETNPGPGLGSMSQKSNVSVFHAFLGLLFAPICKLFW